MKTISIVINRTQLYDSFKKFAIDNRPDDRSFKKSAQKFYCDCVELCDNHITERKSNGYYLWTFKPSQIMKYFVDKGFVERDVFDDFESTEETFVEELDDEMAEYLSY